MILAPIIQNDKRPTDEFKKAISGLTFVLT